MQHQISPFDENLSCALQNNRTFNGKTSGRETSPFRAERKIHDCNLKLCNFHVSSQQDIILSFGAGSLKEPESGRFASG